MLDIKGICDLYAWLYTDLPVPTNTWDHVFPVDGAFAAVKRLESIDYVMFRGSVTLIDWAEDLFTPQTPVYDRRLGFLHPGFMLGVNSVKDKIDAVVGDNVVVVGHSLGAGHAALYGGYRLTAEKPVNRLIVFGCPRPGFSALKHTLSAIPVYSFRNMDSAGHDLVTDVPFGLGPTLDYSPIADYQDVTAKPRSDDKWLVFKYHHMGLYCRALGATGPASLSLHT